MDEAALSKESDKIVGQLINKAITILPVKRKPRTFTKQCSSVSVCIQVHHVLLNVLSGAKRTVWTHSQMNMTVPVLSISVVEKFQKKASLGCLNIKLVIGVSNQEPIEY